ncbi:MAG: ABC transporter ATP-binding protein [Sulfurospirillaceae bacterium]|nr:ABC transporter ATP-binding protein [Sulfurospirillaceae bacterium]
MNLCVQNLHYCVKRKILLDHICIEAKAGEVLGVIGPNGAGKSTLLKHIAGILPLNVSTVTLDKRDFSQLEPRDLAKEVAYLSQFANTPRISVLEALELGRRAYSGMQLTAIDKKKLDESVTQFELGELLERHLESLSGGERQKVLIASALLQEPKVLLLDEPISHLDPKNQLEMLSAVRKITQEKKLITFIVLHDIQHAIHYTSRLLMLKKGKILHDISTKSLSHSMLEELFDVEASLHISHGHTFVYYGHSHDTYHIHHQHTPPII